MLPDWLADLLPFVVLLLCGGWWIYFEERDAERRRTAPERARRSRRDLEHAFLVQVDAEQLLRRMLIEDLRQVAAKRWAYEQLGIEYPRPAPTPLVELTPLARLLRHWRRRRLEPTARERRDATTGDAKRDVLRDVDANE